MEGTHWVPENVRHLIRLFLLHVRWYGAFLLACYDPETEEYQSVCKIGTGFSEEFLAKVKPQLDALIVPKKPGYFNTGLDQIDVWFEPKTVWEVRAAGK